MIPPSAAGVFLGALLSCACPSGTEPQSSEDMGTVGPVTRGKVTVASSAPVAAAGAALSIRVGNGLESAVYTEDSKTDCSIVVLERKDGETWTRIAGCAVERPPAVVALGPGRVRDARIDPSSVHLGGNGGSPAFGAGLYRIRFSFRTRPEPAGIEPETVFSDPFRIEP